jgi:hypothetical protein
VLGSKEAAAWSPVGANRRIKEWQAAELLMRMDEQADPAAGWLLWLRSGCGQI